MPNTATSPLCPLASSTPPLIRRRVRRNHPCFLTGWARLVIPERSPTLPRPPGDRARAPPDLLLLVPLRGLSAQAMEAAPCNPAPASSGHPGALRAPQQHAGRRRPREAGRPVAAVAPPDHPNAIEAHLTIANAARAAVAHPPQPHRSDWRLVPQSHRRPL